MGRTVQSVVGRWLWQQRIDSSSTPHVTGSGKQWESHSAAAVHPYGSGTVSLLWRNAVLAVVVLGDDVSRWCSPLSLSVSSAFFI